MSAAELAHLERLGFERSAFTTTRWVKHQPIHGGATSADVKLVASLDITPTGLKFSAWPDINPHGQKATVVQWDNMQLVPLLVYCQIEGLL